MAKQALGTVLKKGTTTIAELTSISGLDISADTIDVTNLSSASGFREFIGGLKDAGEVGVSGFLNVGATSGQEDMLTDLVAGTVGAYTIEFPASMGASWSFDAIVTKFTTGAELEDAISFEASLKVTGVPTLVVG